MRIGNKRASFIDYTKPGIYLITMNKNQGVPEFSRLFCYKSGGVKKVGVKYYDLGFIVYHGLKNFHTIVPSIEIMQYVIMPDHLHILLQITEKLNKPLGDYLAVFKRNIFIKAQKNLIPFKASQSIFERGFNDQFLRYDRNLNVIFEYIRNNPARLWNIKQDPQFFSRVCDKVINDVKCNLYGNLNLLDNPFICDVIIHRRDTSDELNRKKELWRYILANGGVLAGAFISESEREIFNGAAKYGGKIILISNKSFAKREKPSKELFNLCARGQLLIISPELSIPLSETGISRAECLQLNSFAENLSRMAGNQFSWEI